ncbi:MAG: hypothetical protein Q9212_003847 [Teloschistes hypoglaucus]
MANTLDFSAEEVLALPMQDRMKAILRAHGGLPASLIYNAERKLGDPTCRWVPLYPERLGLNDVGGSLRQTQDGFMLDKTKGDPVGFLVDPSLPREARIRLEYAGDSDPLWISFNVEPDGPPVSWAAAVDPLAVCYLVSDLSSSLQHRSLTRRPEGARFALRRVSGTTLHLVYEYSFFYSVQRRWEDQERDYRTVRAERTGKDAVFHIDCGMGYEGVIKVSAHGPNSPITATRVRDSRAMGLTSPSRPLLLPMLIYIIRLIIGTFEILRLQDRINEHAYKAWVKTFDRSGSLKKRTERSDGAFLEIGLRIKDSSYTLLGGLCMGTVEPLRDDEAEDQANSDANAVCALALSEA